jgi:2-polyprenyl-3-methyl-5-hydroxy-6-metoxy-1,4-benzoquinol methylase
LDVGSSTSEFRTVSQSHIDKNIFQPLREKGVKISHMDLKKGTGVDIVADISSERFTLSQKYDLVICTNLLEHVLDLKTTIFNISSLIREGGYLLITVPLIYPYHPDPIDNLSRFTPQELSRLFSLLSFQKIYATIIYPRLPLTKWARDLAMSFYKIFHKKNCAALIFNLRCFLSKPKVSLIMLKKSTGK